MLPGSVIYHYVSHRCGKPVTMNYLTKFFSTKYKLKHDLARNQGNEVEIMGQDHQCLLYFN